MAEAIPLPRPDPRYPEEGLARRGVLQATGEMASTLQNNPGTPTPIKVDDTVQPPALAPIQVDTGGTPSLPADVVDSRSDKASFGLDKPYDLVRYSIASGLEDDLRRSSAEEITAQRRQKYMNEIGAMSAAKQGPLTTQEIDKIRQEFQFKAAVQDHRSVFEESLTRKYYQRLYGINKTMPDSWYKDILTAAPEQTDQINQIGASFFATNQYLLKKQQDLQARYNQQSWLGYLGDVSKDVLTMGLFGEYKKRGQVEGPSFFKGLLGTNMQEQRLALLRMPAQQRYNTIDRIVETMDPRTALDWLEHIQGNSDVDLTNLYSGITLATPPGVGKGINLLGRAMGAAKDVARASHAVGPAKVLAPAAAGDVAEAAVQKSADNLIKEITGNYNPLEHILDGFPSILDLQMKGIKAGPGNYREVVNRMEEQTEAFKARIIKEITSNARVSKIPEALATEENRRTVFQIIKDKYPGLSSNVSDWDLHWSPTGNHFAELKLRKADGTNWGRPESVGAFAFERGLRLAGTENMERQHELQGLIWLSEPQLTAFRRDPELFKAEIKSLEDGLMKYHQELAGLRKSPGAQIVQDGGGYYLSHMVPVPETDKLLQRATFFTTKESKTPSGYIGSLLSPLRTPEETFSEDARTAAKLAIIAPVNILKAFRDELKDINNFKWTVPGTTKKMEANRLEQVMRHGQTMQNPETGKLGYTFKSPEELENYYLTKFGDRPSDGAVATYFAWKRFNAAVEQFKWMGKFSKDIRRGAMEHRLVASDAKGNRVYSNNFDAIPMNAFPKGDELVLVVGNKPEDSYVRLAKNIRDKELRESVTNGKTKAMEILHPEHHPLKGFGNVKDQYIRYAINDKAEVRPLKMKVGNPDVAAFEQDAKFSIVQPIVKFDPELGKYLYYGDKTYANVDHSAIGNNITNKLNAVMEKLYQGDEAGAQAAAKVSAQEWKDMRALWEGENALSKEIPMYLVPNGKTVYQLNRSLQDRYVSPKGKSLFRDISRSIDTHGEPDVYDQYTIRDKGTKGNPLYYLERSPIIDPIPSINRAMNKIINSMYMDDFRAFIVDHWTQEAMQHEALEASRNEVEAHPEWYFHNGKLKPGTPLEIRSRLEGNRFKAKQLMGVPSKTQAFLHSVEDYVTSTMYDKFGPGTRIAPTWMLSKIPDAASGIRSFTYNSVMGLFALPQAIVQNMTYASILGIAGPTMAIKGTLGAILHQVSRFNPEWINTLDKIASQLGWRPGELKEAKEAMIRTGFHNLGAEHAGSSQPFNTNIIRTGLNEALDLGSIIVREADRNVRFGAWYTAWKEMRDKFPTGPLNNYDLGRVFNRAEDLSGNMTQASKSLLQQGPLAFTTQFLSFNMRLAELMTGHRLSRMEKTRLFATYYGLFGVSALGVYGYPWGDTVTRTLRDHGYNVGDNAINDLLVHGIPAAVLAQITGQQYNVGQRFGATGFDSIRDAWTGDSTLFKLAGGATYSTLAKVWEQSDGFRAAMGSLLRDDDTRFEPKMADFVDIAKTISSANIGVRALHAANTGNWLSSKGQVIESNIPLWEALFMSGTGMQRQSMADLHNISISENDRKQLLKITETQFLKEYNRFIQSVRDNDPEQTADYGRRIKALLVNYPIEKRAELFARGAKGLEPMVRKANWNYFMGKDVPLDQQEALRRSYIRQQEILQGKQ